MAQVIYIGESFGLSVILEIGWHMPPETSLEIPSEQFRVSKPDIAEGRCIDPMGMKYTCLLSGP